MPTPILEALLDSVTAQAHQLCCVDISLARWAAPWFIRNGLDPNVDQSKLSAHCCDLVICSIDQLKEAKKLAIPGGLILARGMLENQTSSSDALSSLQQTAKICSKDADWTLFSVSATTAYDLAIVLITRNQGPQLREYLEFLASYESSYLWQLVVVDLNSEDITSELLDAVDGDISTIRISEDTPTGQIVLHGLSHVDSRVTLVASTSVIPDSNWLDTIYSAEKNFPNDNIFLGQIEASNKISTTASLAIPPVLFALRMTPELLQFDFGGHNSMQELLNTMIAKLGAPRVLPSLFGQTHQEPATSDFLKKTRTG